ncbi:MAG: phage capsid protein [Clostridia bacterium]|nr:phage capsid protein [Clostridia bacterium]
MLTLAQAKNLSDSKLTQWVIDEFRKSALLDSLPFDNTVKPQGGQTLSYVYNRVTTLPTAEARALGSEFTPQETVTTKYTVDLKVLGGAFELDRVIIKYEKQVVDHVQQQMSKKIDATRALFHDLFINGDSGVTAAEFDGLDKALTGSATEITPAADIDLSTTAKIDDNWKAFLDSLRSMRAKLDSAPTLYLMNSETYGKFQSVMDRAGISLASKANYGDEVTQWGPSIVMSLGDKPGTSNPIIETTAGVTSIYAARLALDGVHGVSPDGNTLVEQYLPNLTLPGAVKKGEVEMVAAIALKATKAAGVLRGIKIE